jgi:AcrR family transcriptional regulator
MEVKPKRGPGRPRNQEADREIVAACLGLLGEQGYDRCSMEAVAARAGVTRATVYRRHQSKAELVTAALSTMADGGEAQAIPPGVERVVAVVEAFRSCMEASDALSIAASLYVQRRDNPTLLEQFRERVVSPGRGRLVAALEAAREAGQLRPDADVDLAADALMGGFLMRSLVGVPISPGWAEQTTREIWRGLAAEQP